MNSKNAVYTGFRFEAEGFPAFAVINKDVKSLADRFDYNYAVFIDIVPLEYDEVGHPEGEEYDYLLDVEKKMIEEIEEEGVTIHIGHTTLSLKREIIFYTKAPEKVEAFLQAYLPTIKREAAFEIVEDNRWENVEGFYEQL